MKLIAVLTDPDTIEAVTSALDEDADPIEPRPARAPSDDPMLGFDVPREQHEDAQLEQGRATRRKQLFDAQDQIDERRSGLIDEIERQLQTTTDRDHLFTIRFSIG